MDIKKEIQERLKNKESPEFISKQVNLPLDWINKVFLWSTKII